MKLHHAAVFVLVGWCLMMPLSVRAGGPIAVPGSADVETWYLMLPRAVKVPYHPRPDDWVARTPDGLTDFVGRSLMLGPPPAEPLPGWMIAKTLPSRQECEAQLRANPRGRCISADDPRLKEK